MRFTGILAAVAATASATSFLENGVQSLDSFNIPSASISYSAGLPCGGCIRSGTVYCQNTNLAASNRASTCCPAGNLTCVTQAISNNMACGTTDPAYQNSSSYYAENFQMLA